MDKSSRLYISVIATLQLSRLRGNVDRITAVPVGLYQYYQYLSICNSLVLSARAARQLFSIIQ